MQLTLLTLQTLQKLKFSSLHRLCTHPTESKVFYFPCRFVARWCVYWGMQAHANGKASLPEALVVKSCPAPLPFSQTVLLSDPDLIACFFHTRRKKRTMAKSKLHFHMCACVVFFFFFFFFPGDNKHPAMITACCVEWKLTPRPLLQAAAAAAAALLVFTPHWRCSHMHQWSNPHAASAATESPRAFTPASLLFVVFICFFKKLPTGAHQTLTTPSGQKTKRKKNVFSCFCCLCCCF